MLGLIFLTIVSGRFGLSSFLIFKLMVTSRNITHLIYPIDEEAKEFVPEDKEEKLIRQELLDQVKDMKEVLGLRSLSILRYIDSHFCGLLT